MATSLPLCAYMSEVVIIASRDTVGDVGYYFVIYAFCLLPLAYVCLLVLMSLLSVKQIRDGSAYTLSFLDRSLVLGGKNIYM